jgi:hypothetical protein
MSEYIEVFTKNTDRVLQGDIYRDIDFIESFKEYEEKDGTYLKIELIHYPYIIVLTQDCDLEQDYKNKIENGTKEKDADKFQDKYLFSVIVAPLYIADDVIQGVHLSKLGYKMQNIRNVSTSKVGLVMLNEIPRYHYLNILHNPPIPASIIDFKHYFTVTLEELTVNKKANYIRTIKPLFREKVSQRFSSYLSRIGLPDPPP